MQDDNQSSESLLSDSGQRDVEQSATIIDPVNHEPKGILTEILRHVSGTLPLQIIKQAVPISTGIMFSQLGPTTRAAAQNTQALENLASMVFNSPTYYIPTAVSKTLNEANDGEKHVGREAQAGWITAVVCALPQVVMFYFAGEILLAFKQPIEESYVTSRFFRIYTFAPIPLSIQSASEMIAIGTNNVYGPSVVQTVGVISGVSIASWLSFDKKMGVRGISWGLVARSYLSFILYTSYLLGSSFSKNGSFSRFSLFKKQDNLLRSLKVYALNGIMFFVLFLFEIGSYFITSLLIGLLSNPSLALQLQLPLQQYQTFTMIPATAIGLSAQTLVAKYYSSQPSTAKKVGLISTGLSIVFPLIYLIFSCFAPKFLMRPFFDPSEEKNKHLVSGLLSKYLFIISGFTSFFSSTRQILTQSLLGADKVMPAIGFNLLSTWLGTGLAYLCGFTANQGVSGVNIGIMTGQLTGTLITLYYYQRIKWTPSLSLNSNTGDPLPAHDLSSHNGYDKLESNEINQAAPSEHSKQESPGRFR